MDHVIKTQDGVRISMDSWDDGGAWLGMQLRGASAHAVLTRGEAQALLEALQAILSAKVAA